MPKYELSEKQKQEIDDLFLEYEKDKDKEKLLKELKRYAFEDGRYSLYIRWNLDTIIE